VCRQGLLKENREEERKKGEKEEKTRKLHCNTNSVPYMTLYET
jgi:hypothetical protein